MRDRRNQYDVSNTVKVTDPSAVAHAICELYTAAYPETKSPETITLLKRVVSDFARLFRGDFPGYYGCDTLYHDLQHTMDMTLANARLLSGHEQSADPSEQLGEKRFLIGIITALFHDSGYIRRHGEDQCENGAEYTLTHVTRSAHFLREYLPTLGLGDYTAITDQLVHYTGYEIQIEEIQIDDEKYRTVGKMLGTADLIAQMSDRCYLEKCRDRLYPEFVLGGIARTTNERGEEVVLYESAEDLLKKTPSFYEQHAKQRLNDAFSGVYRYIETVFNGKNPYFESIDDNLSHLKQMLDKDSLHLIRRRPPFTRGLSLFPMLRVV